MRRVRLTEGQLHNVIRESVSQILNELDWKTYDNAARKRRMQIGMNFNKDYEDRKILPLKRAAADAYNKKYPHLSSIVQHEKYGEQTPEEQKEGDAATLDYDKHQTNHWRYEKGGRGYYLDNDIWAKPL